MSYALFTRDNGTARVCVQPDFSTLQKTIVEAMQEGREITQVIIDGRRLTASEVLAVTHEAARRFYRDGHASTWYVFPWWPWGPWCHRKS